MKVHLSPRKKPRKQSLTSNVRALEKGEQENEEEIQFVIKTKLNEDIESHLKDGEYKCDTCEKILSLSLLDKFLKKFSSFLRKFQK